MCLTSPFFRVLCSHVRIFAVGFNLGISPTNAPCQHVEEDLPPNIWPTWWPAVIMWTQGCVCLYEGDISISGKRQSCFHLNTKLENVNHVVMETLKLLQGIVGEIGWAFVSMTDCCPHPFLPLVLILWDVSVAHVCECQWKAALWLFYELHYWFPILRRTENVIMHRPRPNPPHPRQTDLLLSLPSFAFLSLTLWLFINLSSSPAWNNAPPPITWPI